MSTCPTYKLSSFLGTVMAFLIAYLRARLVEASTLRGLILLGAGIGGVTLSDSDANTLVSAGQIVAGALGAVLADRLKKS
jgi:hypothetical protein